ncbi:MAG: Arc family DNA-binding protein [Chloroflexi bacterium]|nr:Arc family DNA-binding protein [Chloroflexota bacterium]MBM3182454.1 Arc family DNA-binding protein [Chloroflexota bacterium]MBM4451823.1 Arc family DNA-binding protein [Chloroflexota bacterium]MBM4453256.1 Arc family DNA-binding protein [Chloroflexota bacterium]
MNVSLKNVPDDIVEKLRKRAKRHHRSLQGELMVILEEAVGPARLSVDQAEARLRELRFETRDESTSWLRELRDVR